MSKTDADKPRIKLTKYINIGEGDYPDQMFDLRVTADAQRTPRRACVEVEINCVEGEGCRNANR